jgi:site-specific recombinase XerD
MRGGMGAQVTTIFNQSGIFQPSESKHEAKAEARSEGARNSAEIAEKTAIYSYQTAESYKDVWHQLADFAKAECGLKDIEKLSSTEVKVYLESRISDGVAHSTFQKECAAINKLENALNSYADKRGTGREYNFRETVHQVKDGQGKSLERSDLHRAYTNPQAVIGAIERADHRLAAEIQHSGGARISEMNLIKSSQLKGEGKIEVQGKGGKMRELQVSEKIYSDLKNHIEKNGSFSINKDAYGRDLRSAALASGQDATGSHGLRWNFAQNRMVELQQSGKVYEQALAMVSHEMGHERPDITEHYLR